MGDRLLKASDRCDRCGARAYARAFFTGDPEKDAPELSFCAHHWAEYGAAVREVAFAWLDETEYVLEAD